jgi:hypothetical protein
VDVTEVGFEALARIVVERNEGLALPALLAADIAADAVVAPRVVVLGAQAAKNLGGGVPLFTRGLLVGFQDGVDDRLEGIDHRRQRASLVRFGLRLGEDLADFAPRVMEPARQFADAHFVHAMSASDACVFVHLDHP